VKLISPRGPYDHLLLVEERAAETEMYETIATQNKTVKGRTLNYPEKEKKFVDERLENGLL
jgi:hypothetical protein